VNSAGLEPSVLVMRIQPAEGISLRFGTKAPGPKMRLRSVSMDFRYGSTFSGEPQDAYARLLLDVIAGDPALFTRRDEVERAWSLVGVVRDGWAKMPALVPNYAAGEWGPPEADRLLSRAGRAWR
jgi:glucose-6-phosphate 1-dehydrogenase